MNSSTRNQGQSNIFIARTGLQQHPLSAAFPAMTNEERIELRGSIQSQGVLNPITIYDGMVLDGWNRYSLAAVLGMECPATELKPDIDPKAFVIAQNSSRRHVTKAQLAMAVTAVYEWAPQGANQYQRVHTQCEPSTPTKHHTECEVSKTRAELAEIAGVHPNVISQAQAVHTNAAPEVLQAVKSGDIGLTKAAAIAKLPKAEQVAAIDKPLPKSTKPAPASIDESDPMFASIPKPVKKPADASFLDDDGTTTVIEAPKAQAEEIAATKPVFAPVLGDDVDLSDLDDFYGGGNTLDPLSASKAAIELIRAKEIRLAEMRKAAVSLGGQEILDQAKLALEALEKSHPVAYLMAYIEDMGKRMINLGIERDTALIERQAALDYAASLEFEIERNTSDITAPESDDDRATRIEGISKHIEWANVQTRKAIAEAAYTDNPTAALEKQIAELLAQIKNHKESDVVQARQLEQVSADKHRLRVKTDGQYHQIKDLQRQVKQGASS
jgi:hypothetical protein